MFVFAVDEMDQYLGYIGGPAGALALTGVAAASAFYLASRPTAEKPLVDLNHQASVLPVIKYFILKKKPLLLLLLSS